MTLGERHPLVGMPVRVSISEPWKFESEVVCNFASVASAPDNASDSTSTKHLVGALRLAGDAT
jgi:hypothetical protein